MKVRAKERSFSNPYLVDIDQSIYPQYGATKTPSVFLLNKEKGKNIVNFIGAIDNNYDYENPADITENYVEEAVNELLEGKEITRTYAMAVGCSIKVKK